jgi:hypothetical protein
MFVCSALFSFNVSAFAVINVKVEGFAQSLKKMLLLKVFYTKCRQRIQCYTKAFDIVIAELFQKQNYCAT